MIRRLILFITMLAVAALLPAGFAGAQSAPQSISVGPVPITGDPTYRPNYVPAASGFAASSSASDATSGPDRKAPTAIFVPVYTGSPSAAQKAAVQRALDIWSTQIVSNVPITVAVAFGPTVGGAIAQVNNLTWFRDFPGATLPGVYYIAPLAEKLNGNNFFANDINVTISDTAPYYLGLDGAVPPGQYDLVSVGLKLVGHGLGVVGGFVIAGPNAQWVGGTFPTSWDLFLENGAGQSLLTFPTPSAALKAQLESDSVYWDGPAAVAANGGVKPRVSALAVPIVPSPLLPAVLPNHWNEGTYPSGNINSLMTPLIAMGEAIHDTGPITRGALADIGWTMNSESLPSIKDHQLSAVSTNSADVLIAGRSPGNLLWYRETDNTIFGPWTYVPLTSGIMSRPEAVKAPSGDLYIFYRGAANDLRYVRRPSGSTLFGADVSLGGVIGGDIVSAVDGSDNLVVVGHTPGGQPYYRLQHPGTSTFDAWTPIGGLLEGELELVTTATGDLMLFGLDAFGSLFVHRFAPGGAPGVWTQLGGVLTGRPSAATSGAATTVFGLSPSGNLFYRTFSGGWGPFVNLGGVLRGDTDAAAFGNIVGAWGTGPNGGLWDRMSAAGGPFGPFEALGGVIATGPEVTAVGSGFYAFANTADGGTWFRWFVDADHWGDWTNLGGVLVLESTP